MREKSHRLPKEAYDGQICLALTACEKRRRAVLANEQVFTLIKHALEEAAPRGHCTVPIYTLMPDHLHFLVLGIDDTSRVLDAVNHFKWKTGFDFYKQKLDIAWQKDFYDHIVRWSEGWRTQARYTALNPVRAGLVGEPGDWPFTGSVGYDLKDVLDDTFM